MDVPRVAARVALAVAVVTVGAVWISTSGTDTAHGGADHAAAATTAAVSPGSSTSASAHGSTGHPVAPGTPTGGITTASLRDLPGGGREVSLPLPEGAYTPSAPNGGTDDYRCFLLDPGVTADTFLTGTQVLPGNSAVAHHAILFRVDPEQLEAAREVDAASPGQGWTCFGDTGIPRKGGVGANLDDSGWLGAWAPGATPASYGDKAGVPLAAGSRIVLQMHYNLLAGTGPDTSGVRLTMAAPGQKRAALRTMLMPAPVELPCTPSESGPLCDRALALEDLEKRFGREARGTVGGLQLLCGGDMYRPKASSTQECVRPVTSRMTIHAVAGHMHLLGRSISLDLLRASGERTLLDIPQWDFDDQGARRLDAPVTVGPGDELRVRCTWDAGLRAQLPALRDKPARYVTWGEGTSDEMCLAILTVSS